MFHNIISPSLTTVLAFSDLENRLPLQDFSIKSSRILFPAFIILVSIKKEQATSDVLL